MAEALLPSFKGHPLECRAVAIGGGRGLFATTEVPAGTVLFSEEPLIFVGAEDVRGSETWHMAVARCVLQSKHRAALLAKVQEMHPQRLCDLPDSVLAGARLRHQTATKRLADSAVPPVTVDEALILLLKVQMNAFSNGLFAKLYLLNHADYPNCRIFSEGERMGCTTGSRSELVATRALHSGDEINISFFGCVERSAARCQLLFEQQHLVQLVSGSPPPVEELESFAQGVDNSPWARDALAQIEDQLDCAEFKERLEFANRGHSTKRISERDLEHMTELEQSALRILHPRHVVLARIHRLMARMALILISDSFHTAIAVQLITSSIELLATQTLYSPDAHWDLIETKELLADGIRAMLSNSRNHLFEAFPLEYGDFRTASLAEAALRKEAAKIRQLYSDDKHQPLQLEELELPIANRKRPLPEAAADEDWSIFD